MKSRSHHRLPVVDPPDDWVNGSWTVDCACGVNFDDGEEMVNCDECGVWVHTRCSRYVKGENSFACYKCKNRNSRNDREETEVAQLLAELPTKTMRMDNHSGYPPRRPFRIWTHRPMEERVHVQGIPGGEPSLFGRFSTIFTPELWKCTGHVPKKFSFQYREFPCWEEKGGVNNKTDEENHNPVDKGAGVLFSLSKKVMGEHVVTTSSNMKGQVDESGCDGVAGIEALKKCESDNMGVGSPQKDVEEDGKLLRPFLINSRRKNEDLGTNEDQSLKKKVRLVSGEGDPKKRIPKTSMTASAPLSDTKYSFLHEGGGTRIVTSDTQGVTCSDIDMAWNGPLTGDEDVVKNNVDKSDDKLSPCEKPQENNAFDVSRQSLSIRAAPMEDKGGHKVYARTKDSSKTDDGTISFMKHNIPGSILLKEEVVYSVTNDVDDKGSDPPIGAEKNPKKSDPPFADKISTVSEGTDNENNMKKPLDPDDKVEKELDISNLATVKSSTLRDAKTHGTKSSALHVGDSTDHLSANLDALKAQNDGTCIEAVSKCETDVAERIPSSLSQPISQVVESEPSAPGERTSADLKVNLKVSAHPSKVSRKSGVPQAASIHRNVSAASSSSSAIRISKPFVSDDHKPSDTKKHNFSTKIGISDHNSNVKREKERREMHRKVSREHPKLSVDPVLKASHSSKISLASEAKKTVSELKHSAGGLSSKMPPAHTNGVTSGLREPANSSQMEEKVNLSNGQSCTKTGHSSPMHPPVPSNSPAILSDEELALLLHQELNSSPRVPRVPRMRHSGSLPQLGSPTATTMLVKRTSSSGGRDQIMVARRKCKDSPKEGSHGSRDFDDGIKDKLPLSPGPRDDKSVRATDALSKREADGVGKGVHTGKKNVLPPPSSTTTSSRPFSSSKGYEQKSGSARHPLRSTSDDDAGSVRGHTHQTLPGLLSEIMGKGKRMTYEELCNAVLPHWPNLRKHNGERYAYSSHSQAVLDCLRNRHEWAQLVDRGPKTNAGRKRRKLDTETLSNESEDDDDYEKNSSAKEAESRSLESRRKGVPKGKRKARKRRRLALQGRRAKDVRRRRKADEVSNDGDDNGSFSSSSEDSTCSDDEKRGDETCPTGSEASSSSDEGGPTS